MIFKQADIIFTVETSVHHQFYFGESEEIQICQQVLNRLGIRDVSG